eukprot:m.82710 g.82710  ORF g.82710 m.82710 type:complete len:164 (+) comp11128_c0_seq2:1808-2299(+)
MPPKIDVSKLALHPTANPFDIHVYFRGEDQAATAADVQTRMLQQFPWLVKDGWSDRPSGPHPTPSFAVEFGDGSKAARVNEVIAWLDANRRGLSVLVHPNTSYFIDDHLDLAVWLGKRLELRGESFVRKLQPYAPSNTGVLLLVVGVAAVTAAAVFKGVRRRL